MIYPAPWLDPADINPTRLAIVQWVLARVGVYEMPPGSNRSGLINQWNVNAGAPLGSAWCAAFARAAWSENGVDPLGDAACEHWHVQAHLKGRLVSTPAVGDVALFDFGTQQGYADHCGIVVRTDPTVLTGEGNTNESGGREGVGVFVKDRGGAGLIGYVSVGL